MGKGNEEAARRKTNQDHGVVSYCRFEDLIRSLHAVLDGVYCDRGTLEELQDDLWLD